MDEPWLKSNEYRKKTIVDINADKIRVLEIDTLPEEPFRHPFDVLSIVYENVSRIRKVAVEAFKEQCRRIYAK